MADTPVDTEGQASSAGPEATSSAADQKAPQKADIGKRIVAAVIDAVIAMVVGFIPFIGGLAATAYWLVRDGMDLEFMDHRSIGKKIVKLRPVTLDGSPVDIMTSVKRNWMFAIAGVSQLLAYTIVGLVIAIPLAFAAFAIGIVEIVLVITDSEGRRLGDKLGGTRVIETTS